MNINQVDLSATQFAARLNINIKFFQLILRTDLTYPDAQASDEEWALNKWRRSVARKLSPSSVAVC